MSRAKYVPTPVTSSGARIEKKDDVWTLVLVRELRHPPERVWDALTDPGQLSEWAPFDADRNLGSVGPAKLATAGTPMVAETTVVRAEAPRLLEFGWGGGNLRWELEPLAGGTRLMLWHNIDRGFIAWGAAGWHTCFDVLDRLLSGNPMGRLVAQDALQSEGWQHLSTAYAELFGVSNPGGQSKGQKA
jgi:uncharacterized protein YndB with AHSA1/START domain